MKNFKLIENIVRNTKQSNTRHLETLIELFGTYKFNMEIKNYYVPNNSKVYPGTVMKLNLLEMFICYVMQYNSPVYDDLEYNDVVCWMEEGHETLCDLLFDKIVSMFMNNKFTIKRELLENILLDFDFTYKCWITELHPNDSETSKRLDTKYINIIIKYITDRIKVVDDN